MAWRRLRTLLALPLTAARWWRRTTTAPLAEQYLLLVALPATLSLGWLLGIGDGLGFSLAAESLLADSRTLLTAFTANYVHIDGRHLFDNLLNFWVTLFGLYPLIGIAGWNRQFRRVAVGYLLGVPFVIAWVTLATLGAITDQPSVGFSGIVAAFLGFIPVALAAAASEVTDGEIDPAWAVVPFLGSLALTFAAPSVWYFPVQPLLAVGCAGFALLAAGLLWRLDAPSDLGRVARELPPDHLLAFLIGTTVFVFGVAGALVLVPLGTNVWGHLTGYVAGFLLPYLGYVITPALTA
ncbi:hypothetical protein EGH24_04945 [Halonotius terrestris]|uniref:Uncharacterized protein n=1 Tax=Halonotius terrestris TaxID=2487750 RepID=A0A8J8TD31_9EURY|nr:hypothetical protein [Halonotius terrestris]TQQ82789.1 hypothetical protein EGH24_04945 [Halonotius terrestris]